MKRLDDAHLYLLFSPELCRGDPWETLTTALAAGGELVQWRGVSGTGTTRADVRHCQDRCTAHGVPLIVNDDPAMAVELDCAGAHVGQSDLPADAARRILGPRRWLGVSTHDPDQLRRAVADGADYVGFGPCFPTATKGYAQGVLHTRAARVLTDATLPVFAIGGITAARVADVRRAGGRRIAVCAAVLGAADPAGAVRALRDVLYNNNIASPNE